MRVLKRSGNPEDVSFDKILNRLKALAPVGVNADILSQKVIAGLTNGMTTTTLDDLAAYHAVSMSYQDPVYTEMAAKIFMSNHHKNTIHNLQLNFPDVPAKEIESSLYAYTARALYENTGPNGVQSPLINPYLYALITTHAEEIEAALEYTRDYRFDYQGAFMLVNGHYLLQGHLQLQPLTNSIKPTSRKFVTIERPQHMFMRYALSLWIGAENDPAFENAPRLVNLTDSPESTRASSIDWTAYKNSYAIDSMLNAVDPILRKHLPKPTYRRLIGDPELPLDHAAHRKSPYSTINWSEVIEYLERAHPVTWEAVKTIVAGYEISWADVYTHAMTAVSTSTAQDRWRAQWPQILESYLITSAGYLSLPTPTMYNIGTLRPQCSSCFLMDMPADSLDGITKYWHNGAFVSKFAGGIGSSISSLRARGSYIASTNGKSNGLQPFLQVINEVSHYIDQGGGKREGSHTVYVEVWHADILDVLKLKKPSASADERAHVLLYAIWCCDEFMRAAQANKPWYIMDPKLCPRLKYAFDRALSTTWLTDEYIEANKADYEFTYLYRQYVKAGFYTKQIRAQDLLNEFTTLICDAGGLFWLYKDAVNRKSAQMNQGTITCSNLCTEIVEYCSPDEIAVCTLLSLCIQRFIYPVIDSAELVAAVAEVAYRVDHPTSVLGNRPNYFRTDLAHLIDPNNQTAATYMAINWANLEKVMHMSVRNLNKVMDQNFYPVPEAAYSNSQSRPMAVGLQGLADLYIALRIPFDSDIAEYIGFSICECMYYAALQEGVQLAIKDGSYARFDGSPASQGLLQHDLWAQEQDICNGQSISVIKYPTHYDWNTLRAEVKAHGLRNSLYIGMMPTGSSSAIQGSSPCIEPLNALSYKKKNKYGEFNVVNRQFVADMQALGLWDEQTRAHIANSRKGSVFDYERIPAAIRAIYATVWDIPMKRLINMNLSRSIFIDQSSSFNWFESDPTPAAIAQMQYYGWRRGIKTGSYYLRRLAVVDAQKVSGVQSATTSVQAESTNDAVCYIINGKKSCCEA
jgi:ribonucleoside-diphosphate reductase alpha subunit